MNDANDHQAQRQAERQAKVNAVLTAHRRKQRNRSLFVYGGLGLLAIAVITIVAFVVTGSVQSRTATEEAAKKPIAGIETYSNLTRNHVKTAVGYPQVPGVGGDHSATWTNCGTYPEPVNEERAVHSLEHGAVWITYKPGISPTDLGTLTTLVKNKPYVLLSPNPDQTSAVTASAWGTQLNVPSADDSRLPVFIKAYAMGPQTPEPGAACSGGTNG
ncbi:DUF3105 domain-containing protein [Arthrobacter sp. H35-D1]|uniref:DUF3105 domain-containing protein n=1 Tax=Arthrobacter sp. H35-D1 TaxID=3046202 RepID=UPI0024BB184B|nr:DUF3105 domain-containing protein [Arthrobacter sp. H35-D1]MDJ0313170.1 DUF3105 domain-containing protein [Arthrobacter sp. H35-D1]